MFPETPWDHVKEIWAVPTPSTTESIQSIVQTLLASGRAFTLTVNDGKFSFHVTEGVRWKVEAVLSPSDTQWSMRADEPHVWGEESVIHTKPEAQRNIDTDVWNSWENILEERGVPILENWESQSVGEKWKPNTFTPETKKILKELNMEGSCEIDGEICYEIDGEKVYLYNGKVIELSEKLKAQGREKDWRMYYTLSDIIRYGFPYKSGDIITLEWKEYIAITHAENITIFWMKIKGQVLIRRLLSDPENLITRKECLWRRWTFVYAYLLESVQAVRSYSNRERIEIDGKGYFMYNAHHWVNYKSLKIPAAPLQKFMHSKWYTFWPIVHWVITAKQQTVWEDVLEQFIQEHYPVSPEEWDNTLPADTDFEGLRDEVGRDTLEKRIQLRRENGDDVPYIQDKSHDIYFEIDMVGHGKNPYYFGDKKLTLHPSIQKKMRVINGKKYLSEWDILLLAVPHQNGESISLRGEAYICLLERKSVTIDGTLYAWKHVRYFIKKARISWQRVACLTHWGKVQIGYAYSRKYIEEHLLWKGKNATVIPPKAKATRSPTDAGEGFRVHPPESETVMNPEDIPENKNVAGDAMNVSDDVHGFESTTPFPNWEDHTVVSRTQLPVPVAEKCDQPKEDISPASPSSDLLLWADLTKVWKCFHDFLRSLPEGDQVQYQTYDGILSFLDQTGYDGDVTMKDLHGIVSSKSVSGHAIQVPWKVIREFRGMVNTIEVSRSGERYQTSNGFARFLIDTQQHIPPQFEMESAFNTIVWKCLSEETKQRVFPRSFSINWNITTLRSLAELDSTEDASLRHYNTGIFGILEFLQTYDIAAVGVKHIKYYFDERRIHTVLPTWEKFLNLTLNGKTIYKLIKKLKQKSGLWKDAQILKLEDISEACLELNVKNTRLSYICSTLVWIFHIPEWPYPRIPVYRYTQMVKQLTPWSRTPVYILEFLASVPTEHIEQIIARYSGSDSKMMKNLDAYSAAFWALIELWKNGHIIPHDTRSHFVCTHPVYGKEITEYLAILSSPTHEFPPAIAQALIAPSDDHDPCGEKGDGAIIPTEIQGATENVMYPPEVSDRECREVVRTDWYRESEDGMDYDALFGGRKNAIVTWLEQLSEHPSMRPMQWRAFHALARWIASGQILDGYIKMPTWTGKTVLFSHVLRLLWLNTIILVPRTNLVGQTYTTLRGIGIDDASILGLSCETNANIVSTLESYLRQNGSFFSLQQRVVIFTYNTFITFMKESETWGKLLAKYFSLIIEDEAHRWDGKNMNHCRGEFIDAISEDEGEISDVTWEEWELAERYLAQLQTLLFLRFTATPKSRNNGEDIHGKEIFSGTIAEGVSEWSIILPQVILSSSVHTEIDRSWKRIFVTEAGMSYEEDMIAEYLKVRASLGWRMITLVLARNIVHAGDIVSYFTDRGIHAVWVTDDPDDISPDEAVQRIENHEIEVVVTVMKIAEGFDYPKLQCLMNMGRVFSPTKIVQVVWRVMRVTPEKRPDTIMDSEGRFLPSPNTYIITPRSWKNGDSVENRILHYYLTIIQQGEISPDEIPNCIKEIYYKKAYEHGNTYMIENTAFTALAPEGSYAWISVVSILRRLDWLFKTKKKIEHDFAWPVFLVKNSDLESIVAEPVYHEWEQVLRNGIEYAPVGSVRRKVVMDFLKNIRSKSLEARSTSWESVFLYPVSHINIALFQTHGQTCSLKESEYICVNDRTEWYVTIEWRSVYNRSCLYLVRNRKIESIKLNWSFLLPIQKVISFYIDGKIWDHITVDEEEYTIGSILGPKNALRKQKWVDITWKEVKITQDGDLCILLRKGERDTEGEARKKWTWKKK